MKEGILTIYDTHSLSPVNNVFCHNTPILKMTINYLGNLVATCSTQGTMIRLYALPSGDKL